MCLNGRWRGFASATKRMATSMTDPGWADRARQLLKTTACWSASQLQEKWTPACLIKNCTSDSCLQWSLRSYCCPETSAKQVTAKKPFCIRQGPQPDGRLDSRKFYFPDESSVQLYPKSCQYCWRTSGVRLNPRFTQKTVKFGGGKIMVWGYIQDGSAREICKVDGNIDSAKYQQIIASQYIPNCKRGQIFQRDGAPCHTSGSTMRFLRGKKIKVLQGWPAHSPDMNIIEHIWGRMQEDAWRSFGMPARWPSMPSPMTSSTSSTTLFQTGWQLFCRPKEPILDINYLTFNPWWNTRLIFHLLFYLFFEKDKMQYNLIDYYLRQYFCPGRNWLVHHYQAINLLRIYEILVLIVSKLTLDTYD